MTQAQQKLFQASIFVSFLFANIFFGWGIKGIAAPVMGGMAAWYISGITVALLHKRRFPATVYAKERPLLTDRRPALLDRKLPPPAALL